LSEAFYCPQCTNYCPRQRRRQSLVQRGTVYQVYECFIILIPSQYVYIDSHLTHFININVSDLVRTTRLWNNHVHSKISKINCTFHMICLWFSNVPTIVRGNADDNRWYRGAPYIKSMSVLLYWTAVQFKILNCRLHRVLLTIVVNNMWERK
jgi:hypothetical protein